MGWNYRMGPRAYSGLLGCVWTAETLRAENQPRAIALSLSIPFTYTHTTHMACFLHSKIHTRHTHGMCPIPTGYSVDGIEFGTLNHVMVNIQSLAVFKTIFA